MGDRGCVGEWICRVMAIGLIVWMLFSIDTFTGTQWMAFAVTSVLFIIPVLWEWFTDP